MSLQVWLPLNGNLNNQGLSNVTVANNGATVSTSGKIGSCYLVNSDKKISFSSYPWMTMKPQYNFSCFLWVKGTTSGWLFACSAWELMLRPSFIQVHLAGNGQYPASYTATFDTNTWYHLGFTWSGTEGKLRLYLNGSLVATSDVPSSASYDIASSFNIPYDGPRYVNDFRLYDHCLSAKEVKEISKGLIGHWKLDNNGFSNPNLITTMSSGGRTTLNGRYGLNADFSQNSDTYGYFNVSPALELDTTYTLSFDVSNFPKGGSWNFMLWNNANYEVGTITKDGHYTYTFVPSTSKLPSDYSLTKFLFDDGGRTNPIGMVYFTNFKIEKGSVATSWCPHTSDSMYTSLGLNSTTESDCSGLSNNGTKIGGLTPSTSPASIRYESCYNFDGNTGSIQIPNLATLVPNGEFTMNCWIYHDNTWSSKGYETILGGPSGFELEAKPSSTNSPSLYAYSWGQGQATYELNKWNMITMTRNASETKFYINGELKITGSAGTIPSGNYFIGAWNTSSQQNYKGRISDFRLYSNVLSVDDIKELYTTSASVDKNGNMYAYEFKEE